MDNTTSQAPFIPGLKLSEHFYHDAVRPILEAHFPSLPYAAALIGDGSEVLGFDDAMSTDHHWGLRLLLFLEEDELEEHASAIDAVLSKELPYEIMGYSTNFSPPDPNDNGVQHAQVVDHGPVNHMISVHTVSGFVENHLGFDISQDLEAADWLTFPMQKLRSLVSGAVYHDDIGLEEVRARFAYYPHDVWLYMLAAGWARIGQEEHLMGRAGLVGDEVGSALLASRLVRDIMRLCFLMERQYAPYPKWFGTAFKQLACATNLWPVLRSVQLAQSWQESQRYLADAYATIARMHNDLGLTEPLSAEPLPFFGRPFQVIALRGFDGALLAEIRDPAVTQIAARQPIGSIDLLSDNTDLLEGVNWRPALRRLYE